LAAGGKKNTDKMISSNLLGSGAERRQVKLRTMEKIIQLKFNRFSRGKKQNKTNSPVPSKKFQKQNEIQNHNYR